MAPVFESGVTYHIFNQGNNNEVVFPTSKEFLLFLWKMRTYLPLYGDLITWCLMPTHFHWQFRVERTEVSYVALQTHRQQVELQRRRWKFGKKAFLQLEPVAPQDKWITLNQAIGQCQRTFTQSTNTDLGRAGSLFRQGFKAKTGILDHFLIGVDAYTLQRQNYGVTCFHYIHDNAKAAGIVRCSTDYSYSSAPDYAGLRNGTLCNLKLGRELIAQL